MKKLMINLIAISLISFLAHTSLAATSFKQTIKACANVINGPTPEAIQVGFNSTDAFDFGMVARLHSGHHCVEHEYSKGPKKLAYVGLNFYDSNKLFDNYIFDASCSGFSKTLAKHSSKELRLVRTNVVTSAPHQSWHFTLTKTDQIGKNGRHVFLVSCAAHSH